MGGQACRNCMVKSRHTSLYDASQWPVRKLRWWIKIRRPKSVKPFLGNGTICCILRSWAWASWFMKTQRMGVLQELSQAMFIGLGHCLEDADSCKVIVPPHTGDKHDKECKRCRQALGMRRPHYHCQSTSETVLSADLSGPHPEAIGTTFRYMLVAVFNLGRCQTCLPLVR